MSSLFGIGGNSASTGFYPYLLERSLRFNEDSDSRLERRPTTTTNTKTFVWSGWIKRGALGSGQGIFGTATGAASEFFIMQFTGGSNPDTIFIQGASTPSSSLVENVRLGTTQVFRDTGAWYHIVLAVDTTQATASNRLKLYVNGDSITDFSSGNNTYPTTQDFQTPINNTSFPIQVGAYDTGTVDPFDGYMAEVNFIDGLSFFSDTSGTANTSFNIDSFGETKEGIWIPKEYTGSRGTNGFYLNFTDDTSAAGFSSVAYTGPIPASAASGTTGTVSGVGFQPDLVWIKNRTNANDHQWFDTVRGIDSSGDQALQSNRTNTESTSNTNGGVSSIDADGFTVKAGTDTGIGRANLTGSDEYNYVAWNWEAGGAPTADNSAGAGNTPTANSVKIDGSNLGSALAGTIPATRLSANTTYGFSIVTYTGTGANGATVAHGLGSAPKMIFIKSRVATSADGNWLVYANPGTGAIDETDYLILNSTADATDEAGAFNDTAATSTVFSLGTFADLNQSGKTYVAYCWTDISGYSKVGSYTGNGSTTGPTITTGFDVGWLMIKKTNASGTSWVVFDRARDPGTQGRTPLFAGEVDAEVDSPNVTFTSTGFQLTTTSTGTNSLNDTFLYMAFKNTRTNAYFRDQSGNGNHFTPTGLEYTDSMPDLPTNSFATFNPLDNDETSIFKNGNLLVGSSTGSHKQGTRSTFAVTHNFYYEACKLQAGTTNFQLGVATTTADISSTSNSGVHTKAQSSGSIGDVIMIAYSADANAMWSGKNGTWDNGASVAEIEAGTTTNATHTGIAAEDIAALFLDQASSYSGSIIANFGQDSSFSGNKIPQGNSDQNGNGDFFYAPPSGYLALCSDNLPNPGIDPDRGDDPEEYFNTVLWTGTGSGQSITGMGFQPDWLWFKHRNGTSSHALFDSVRGVSKGLVTSSSGAEGTTTDLTSFDTDGFTTSAPSAYGSLGSNGFSIVTWGWKAGGAAVSNGNGSITSSVSASPESGFSIVSYTGTGSAATVGHGLGKVPAWIIIKNRGTGTREWMIYHHQSEGVPQNFGMFFTDVVPFDDDSAFNDTAPTADVFSVKDSASTNNAGEGHIAYCFAEIEGYSKFGRFAGVGGADNSFIYLGFKPAWFLIKRVNATGDWVLYDNTRDPFNVGSNRVSANLVNAELTGASNYGIDFVSNGVKLRSGQADTAVSGGTYIYMAFAEQPFKYANAR